MDSRPLTLSVKIHTQMKVHIVSYKQREVARMYVEGQLHDRVMLAFSNLCRSVEQTSAYPSEVKVLVRETKPSEEIQIRGL